MILALGILSPQGHTLGQLFRPLGTRNHGQNMVRSHWCPPRKSYKVGSPRVPTYPKGLCSVTIPSIQMRRLRYKVAKSLPKVTG